MDNSITLDDQITDIVVRLDDDGTADFYFGKWWVNLDLVKSCCETYDIYFNGKVLELYDDQSVIQLQQPTNNISVTFGEERYHRDKSELQRNYMIIRFSEQDHIRIVRDNQYCSIYEHIYTRLIYLYRGSDDDFEYIGLV